ncbi:hypothetical protein [uncultured Arthrobacter sp.]|uniref:hypothetical protein n=1 Tax=uncultured Arthrobacter sp. TaxID=114050 RepID=UPI00262E7345|nr:hypothetical protein [uncultured Arthrobacter sp.]
MARKTQWRENAKPTAARDFTRAELERIRELTAAIPTAADGHPAWQTRELDRIHAAAGRRRGFMLWELGFASHHDPEAAYLEEVEGGLR